MARTHLTNTAGDRYRIELPDADLNELQWKSNFVKKVLKGSTSIDPRTCIIMNNKVVEVKTIIVHSFTMSDVDDPDLYAAEPLWRWQQTEAGKWVIGNAFEPPIWSRTIDFTSYGQRYIVQAKFTEQKLVEYYLKFGKPA